MYIFSGEYANTPEDQRVKVSYVVELRSGEEIRFDDALEASRYAESLEQGSWARVYADVDREAEHAHYMKQAKLICSKNNVDPTK